MNFNPLSHALLVAFLLFAFKSPAQLKQKSKKSKTEQTTTSNGPADKKELLQPFEKVIPTSAITDEGLFKVHVVENRYFYELPDSLLNREMLMVTRIAKTATNIGFGGEEANVDVLRWQRHKNHILVRIVSHEIVAADSLPIHQAVVNSNFEPIMWSFPIKAFGKDSSIVIDVTEFFEKDVKSMGFPKEMREQYKIQKMDEKRSFVLHIHSYPINIETRSVKTYEAAEPPTNKESETISVEISNSMVLLPKEPMKKRYFDSRVGWFARSQTDYGIDKQKTTTQTYLDRWRLEIKDEDIEKFKRGELVEPKKQIVYYVDPATPMKWRKYLKQGVEDWQQAFEAAGFKNAIVCLDPPTKEQDPEWSPEDARYSVIRYLSSSIPNANGPHISDPRSGEIIEADINWYHNVMTLLHNWFFVQTAAINPEARTLEFKEEIMGRLIRFVSAHEVGHTLGLPHNMGSSVAYPVDSLRSPTFTKTFGTAPSIMDYARFNYIAQPGDGVVNIMPTIGLYDIYSIRWGYTPIPEAQTAEVEKPVLDTWIKSHEGDPIYRFGRQQWSGVVDPSSQTEDLGDDAVKASLYGIANLKRIMPNLIEWTSENGKNYEELQRMYNELLIQFNRYVGHVTGNVGGIYEYFKTSDQEGRVYTHVAKSHQEKSIKFINDQVFTTPAWLIDNEIFGRIDFTGCIEKIRQLQVRALNELMDVNRMYRIIENEVTNPKHAYPLITFMDDIRKGVWSELSSGKTIDTYRRNLQKAYIERLHFLIKETKAGQSDIVSVSRRQLQNLQAEMRASLERSTDVMSKIHIEDCLARVDNILNPK